MIYGNCIKRVLDFSAALIVLAVLLVPFLALAALLAAANRGTPFFRQTRPGRHGKLFRIVKFKTMTDEKDDRGELLPDERRLTRAGRLVRSLSLDELPQLINILRGDMSFIGPRPERPEIIAQYMEVMPEFAFRMKVKAGLAGFAQVYGKYNTSPYDKLKLDLTYIENYSVWLDLKLMLLTLKVLFWPDSTEGVESEQVTAFKATYDGRAEKDDN